MQRIALLSDTHNHLDEKIFKYFDGCDQIWHAGDIGTISITDRLEQIKPVVAVHGNIDGADVRRVWPRDQRFRCEQVDVWITHIGGYPGHYSPEVRERIRAKPPGLFICGHSHILKVMNDKQLRLLHINPGAAGLYGFHLVRTMIRFTIEGENIKDLEVIELGKRA
ncbi:MAG: metallophosphoesterase family protein [Bacteroidota bacterium]